MYDNIIVGMSLSFFADLTFFTLEPLFLDKANLSRVRIELIIMKTFYYNEMIPHIRERMLDTARIRIMLFIFIDFPVKWL